MTNADMIRAMSDEDLVFVIMCPNEMGKAGIECNLEDWRNCWECCLKWLKEEAK